jgi:hypothetical protein
LASFEKRAIPDSLTKSKGDPAAGHKIVVSRQSTCLLCHLGPFPEERFQGNLGPDLAGTGSRWSEVQLRLRIVNAASLNPATIMPPFYHVEGLTRVHPAWRGKPILSRPRARSSFSALRLRPLIQHARPLPKRQFDPRPVLDRALEHRASPTETVAGIEQAVDLRAIPRSLLDLVEVAHVGDQRIGSLLVEVNVVGLRIGHGERIRPTEPYGARAPCRKTKRNGPQPRLNSPTGVKTTYRCSRRSSLAYSPFRMRSQAQLRHGPTTRAKAAQASGRLTEL